MPDLFPPKSFPEKVLQFGTGILLRGLPDYFIDQANRQGVFKGLVVAVKSTPGSTGEFEEHSNRFTMCVRGVEDGKIVEEDFVNTSISRVLNATHQWKEVLAVASSKDVQLILSNTTEVGIRFEPESINLLPPVSFPAKLTACLFERFRKLGNSSPELVVIPTELIPDNGQQLRSIVMQVCGHNNLGRDFEEWLSQKVSFCSSLVDRIVTKPSPEVASAFPAADSLTIQAEPYKLWAIEGSQNIKKLLSFSEAGEGVIIADNIDYYRERKIRLLNGTHTISVCLGFLKGFETVYQCMQDPAMSKFVGDVMLNEIVPTIPLGTPGDNRQFAGEVLDRFRNPYTAHRLLSIAFQATAKMKMRNVPTLIRYAGLFQDSPVLMVKGFAAFLLFMRATHQKEGSFYGSRRGQPYPILDDQAAYFYEAWQAVDSSQRTLTQFVREVCQNAALWDKDLTELPKFEETVVRELSTLMSEAGS